MLSKKDGVMDSDSIVHRKKNKRLRMFKKQVLQLTVIIVLQQIYKPKNMLMVKRGLDSKYYKI